MWPLITSVLPVHLGAFFLEHRSYCSGQGQRFLKGWIIVAGRLLPRDASTFEFLAQKACDLRLVSAYEDVDRSCGGACTESFGEHEDSFNIVDRYRPLNSRSSKAGLTLGRHDGMSFEVGLPGRHNVINAQPPVLQPGFAPWSGLIFPRNKEPAPEAYRRLGWGARKLWQKHEDGAGGTRSGV